MKTKLCFYCFCPLPVTKLRPTVAGLYVFQLRAVGPTTVATQPSTEKRGFTYKHNDINIKALGEKRKEHIKFLLYHSAFYIMGL